MKTHTSLDDKKEANEKPFVLSVFIAGTGAKIKSHTESVWLGPQYYYNPGLAASLHQLTDVDENHESIALDGVYPRADFSRKAEFNRKYILGYAFGSGLTMRVGAVVEKVRHLLAAKNQKIVLNCYGHSRGAIAAILIAKELKDVDNDKLEINLALMDPVPGNYSLTYQMDFLGISFASLIEDASDCPHIKKVLSLYPYEPLGKGIVEKAYVPSIPVFNTQNCEVEEDVILSNHMLAQGCRIAKNNECTTIGLTHNSFPTFCRIKTFMEGCGTRFDLSGKKIVLTKGTCWSVNRMPGPEDTTAKIVEDERLELNKIYNQHINDIEPITRATHSKQQLEIVAKKEGAYLNKHHASLNEGKSDNLALSIQPDASIVASVKRSNYVYSILKWLIIGTVISTILFFTGGLAAIPLGGAAAIFSATPFVAALSSAVLNGIIKPAVRFITKIFPDLQTNGDINVKSHMPNNINHDDCRNSISPDNIHHENRRNSIPPVSITQYSPANLNALQVTNLSRKRTHSTIGMFQSTSSSGKKTSVRLEDKKANESIKYVDTLKYRPFKF